LYENIINNDKDLFIINNKLIEKIGFYNVFTLIESLLLETVDSDKESKLIINLVNHMFDRKQNGLDLSHIEQTIENKLMVKNNILLNDLKQSVMKNSKMSYFSETIPYIIGLLNKKLGIKNTTNNYSTKPSTDKTQQKEKSNPNSNQTSQPENNKYKNILTNIELQIMDFYKLPTPTMRKDAFTILTKQLLGDYTQQQLRYIRDEFFKKYGHNPSVLLPKYKKIYSIINKAYLMSFSTKHNKK
jgi:hypothetical protein